jgi:hypothetical protein
MVTEDEIRKSWEKYIIRRKEFETKGKIELLSLEDVFEILGVTSLPGDMDELRDITTSLIERNGEDWVREHRHLCLAQWESL